MCVCVCVHHSFLPPHVHDAPPPNAVIMTSNTEAGTTERCINSHSPDDANKNIWDDALLYQVAVDPFHQSALASKEEGRAAGLRDGFFEGMKIGRTKGWEIGLELGYIYDFSRGIINGYDQNSMLDSKRKSTSLQEASQLSSRHIDVPTHSHRWERCLTLANDLTRMIDEFPDPDSLLLAEHVEENSIKDASSTNDDIYDCQVNRKQSTEQGAAENRSSCKVYMQSSESTEASMLDISASLERIRARLKLLCILLKTRKSFDLKNILESGIGSKISEESSEDTENKIKQSAENKEPRSDGDTIAFANDW